MELEDETYVAYADMDSSPTKAYYVAHRHDAEMKNLYDLAFAVRPGEELYDLRSDPDQIKNVASDPVYADAKMKLETQLMDLLKAKHDPRVSDDVIYEKPPFTDGRAEGGKKGSK
jgi:uncharacterized sulfatase